MFFRWLGLHTVYYNRSVTRTFVWNLHAMNAHSLLLLRDHHREEEGVRRWEQKIWRFVAGDDNPHFAALHMAASGEAMPRAAFENLKRRANENYPGFFAWERDPDTWWNQERDVRGPGLDVLLPYWTLRYYSR
ncbi:MAG: hypothetical protein GY944_26565 [bacterium]|nr:hypothetical protein [bacterium]